MNFNFIYRSSHTFARKFWIHIEMLYQLCSLVFSWFALVRSVIHCGAPWQYLLLSPAYISVLNVYAVSPRCFNAPGYPSTYLLGRQFANIHDVSWGTKADDGPNEVPLAKAVRDKKNEASVTVFMLADQDEINKGYEDAKRMHNAAKKIAQLPIAKPVPNLQVQNEDFFRSIRTYAVLAAIVT
ncbi:hypothetical protein DXG03_006689 [Asterophora parasitica]|uniref:Uncharacterized protein n=1 Tax=Asterophora parasitica TaxID=117018 RepID=A0A9P7G0U8_9AGAR|nr:hypothetical protein DXG03_006689 [Asterophora parasitica]